jgi:hypothetical protein
MPHRRPLLVNSGRQPFELALLAMCVVVGLAGLLTGSSSPVTQFILGSNAWMWNASLVIGGALTILVVFLKNVVTSLLAERVGMVVLATLFLSFGFAVVFLFMSNAIISGGFVIAYGVAASARAIQISNDLNKIRAAAKAITPPPPDRIDGGIT